MRVLPSRVQTEYFQTIGAIPSAPATPSDPPGVPIRDTLIESDDETKKPGSRLSADVTAKAEAAKPLKAELGLPLPKSSRRPTRDSFSMAGTKKGVRTDIESKELSSKIETLPPTKKSNVFGWLWWLLFAVVLVLVVLSEAHSSPIYGAELHAIENVHCFSFRDSEQTFPLFLEPAVEMAAETREDAWVPKLEVLAREVPISQAMQPSSVSPSQSSIMEAQLISWPLLLIAGVLAILGVVLPLSQFGVVFWQVLVSHRMLDRIEVLGEEVSALRHKTRKATCRPRTPAADLGAVTKPRKNGSASKRSAKKQEHPPWTLAVSSNTGRVRTRNEDYAVAFTVDSHPILIVADGCGGVPHGDLASKSAVDAVADLIRVMGEGVEFTDQIAIDRMMHAAIDHAEAKLNLLSKTLSPTKPLERGLRTTLIIAIGTPDYFYWSHIGDGALELVKHTGEHQSLLTPHRPDGPETNILSASLGPVRAGSVRSGRTPRDPGDFLFAATDGVADRVPADFYKDCLKRCLESDGNLDHAIETTLTELAEYRDDSGHHVFDDNLTLGLIAPGTRPLFSRGYWREVGALV